MVQSRFRHTIDPICLLVDNGSLKASSTLTLRRIARALSQKIGFEVAPVSMLHSNAIDPELLGGRPAELIAPALQKRLKGAQQFIVIPVFFGPSGALTRHLPARIAELKASVPSLRVTLAPCLVEGGRPNRIELLAHILADWVEEKRAQAQLNRPAVILVDHGTPAPEVNAVRHLMEKQLAHLLDGKIERLVSASMERREGKAFDFNEPLLEKVIGTEGFSKGDVIVSMLFLSPGRHAGPDGDIARMCRNAEQRYLGLRLHRTKLVSQHPSLVDLLAERFFRAYSVSQETASAQETLREQPSRASIKGEVSRF